MEPIWLARARADIGLRELPGAPTAPKIRQWLETLRAWWRDDETPWCGVAVAAWMQQVSIGVPKHYYRAKAWAEWGYPVAPVVGCVVVFERQGGGHVRLLVGKDAAGRLMVLGGNQGNAVSIAPFERDRAIAYRWPSTELHALTAGPLPIIASSAASSTNEA